ncbi:MAG: TolC family protein [Opitutus sp.]|nr:TolC family protein [Opitutus sp.]
MLSLVLMSFLRAWRVGPSVALVLACVGVRAQSPAVAGSWPEDYLPALKPILQTALRQSLTIVAKEIEIAQREAQAVAIHAQRLPNFGGRMDYASNTTAISGNTTTQTRDNGLFYNVGLNQSVFHWGAITNEIARARIGVLIAQKNHADAYRALAVNLRQQYLGLVAKKASLLFARYALQLVKADLERMEDKLKNGAAAEGDVFGRKLYVDDRSLDLARSEAEFVGSRRAFGRLAGIGDLAEAAIPTEIPAPVYSAPAAGVLVAVLLRDGAKSTFQAEVSALNIRNADLSYRIARVRLLPMFNASAAYTLLNTTNASPVAVTQTGVTQQSVGLNAVWTIFDGFAARGAKLAALADKRLAERQLQAVTEATLDQAQNLERLLALDAQAMQMSEQRRGLAEGVVRRAQEEFKLGNVPQSSIDEATANLRLSESNNALARATFLSRWSEFVSLAGDDPVLNNLPLRYAREKR